MKLKKIPLDKITIPDVRVTAVYDEATQEVLRSTVQKLGVLQPAVVISTDSGFELVDGAHRLEEARRKGDSDIECVVYEGGSVDTLLLNLILNRARGKTKISEMLAVVSALYEEHHLNIEEIEERTGLPRRYIENLIKISQAAPSVLEALDQEIIGVGHALELIRLPSPLQQDEMMAKQSIWKWAVKDLREFVNRVLEEMGKLEAQPAQPVVRAIGKYHCEGCKAETEARYLRPVMLCPDCFGEVWRLHKAVVMLDSAEEPPEVEVPPP